MRSLGIERKARDGIGVALHGHGSAHLSYVPCRDVVVDAAGVDYVAIVGVGYGGDLIFVFEAAHFSSYADVP